MRWAYAGHAATCMQRAIIARLVVAYALNLDQWKGTQKVADVLLLHKDDKPTIAPRPFSPCNLQSKCAGSFSALPRMVTVNVVDLLIDAPDSSFPLNLSLHKADTRAEVDLPLRLYSFPLLTLPFY